MKRGYNSDPAWSRAGSNAKKRRKMCSRASLRLLSTLIRKKRAADRSKEKTVCVTRTVEFPSTHVTGKERSKLLFMLAIGLVPNLERTVQNRPVVSIERLDPAVEAEAKARTRDVIYEIFQRRKLESLQRRLVCHIEPKISSSVISHPTPVSSSVENVELVDLVSSDEESGSANDDELEIVNPTLINGAFHASLHRRQTSPVGSNICNGGGGFRIITSSLHPRKPVFKPLINNQDSGIFRNWKPESMTRLMNLNKTNSEKDAHIPLQSSQSKLLSSLKSIPPPTTLSFRKFTSGLSTGVSCKSHVHGALEDASSSSSVSTLDYIVPDALITID